MHNEEIGRDQMAYDEKTAERVRNVLAGERSVVEKKLMGGLCFMVQGAMCCAVSGRGGMLVRIDPAAHARMLAEPHAQAADMRGRMMTGFVRVAPEGYATAAGLRKWVARGIAAAQQAKQKPRRAKKAARKSKRGAR